MMDIHPVLRVLFIVASAVYLLIILVLLRRKKLNVQYSLIWLASALVFIVFAAFPYLVSVLRDILKVETAANLVFILVLMFVLLLLLSLSTIVTGFSSKITRLSQTQALLEERVRRLEAQLAEARGEETMPAAPAEEGAQGTGTPAGGPKA